jgi:hypothetical protein
VAARFIGDPKIVTSSAPLDAVRQNPATPGTKLREKVGHFVA